MRTNEIRGAILPSSAKKNFNGYLFTMHTKHLPLIVQFAFRKHMIINREFEALLKDNGLDAFDALMHYKQGEPVKQKMRSRFTVRFRLPEGNDTTVLYLKRYRFPLVVAFLKNCLRFSRTYSAVHEWRNILAFNASDLPTMIPVAVGVRRRIPFWNESFLLTKGIPQVTTLEKKIEATSVAAVDRVHVERKRVLIAKLAALTHKMHAQGFIHQDFYLCHILINESDRDAPLLYIADLHRVRKAKKIKLRWRVKDLAALNYSAPENQVSRTDRLRFMKQYDPLLAKDRSFLKAIIKKTEKIRRHDQKKNSHQTNT